MTDAAILTYAARYALGRRGLLLELPPVGSVWPVERRQAWADAVLAAFNVMYERESS